MKKLLGCTGILLASLSLASAQVTTSATKAWVLQAPIISLGDYQCTSVSAATTLSGCAGLAAIPVNTVFAVVQVEGEAARWRCDGTAPTASIGQPVAANTPIYFTCGVLGHAILADLQIIPQTGSMTVDVSFYGMQ